jgi:hypothetical protein
MKRGYTWTDLAVCILAGLAMGACTLLLIMDDGYAADLHVLDLSELSIDYKNFQMVNPNAHSVMTYPDPPKESVNLNLKTNLLIVGYWDSTVESWTTDSQYRAVGLETRIGVRLTDYVDLGLYHHSQHVLDRAEQLPMGHFPVEDAVEIKIYLYKAKDRPSIF